MTQNAIIYTRVSTLEQDYERQIDELQKYADYMNYTVVNIFSEKITGKSKASERIEFSKLIDFVEKNKVDHILVWELSRLGRNMIDCLNTINYFTEKKINIYTKKEGLNSLNQKGEKDVMINIITSIFSGMAEMELETTKARSISGLRASAAAGKAGGSKHMPYGFRKDKMGMLVVDQEEAKIIKEIFKLHLSGLGTTQISNYLNNNNVPTRYQKVYKGQKIKFKTGIEKAGKDFRWVDGTVYSILKNSLYAGKRNFKGEIFEVEAIISEETFNDVQDKLEKNYNKKDNLRKYENLLEDKLKCGKCGRTYFMHKRADGSDNAYKCLSKRYKQNCRNAGIGIDKLDNLVYLFFNLDNDEEHNTSKFMSDIDNKLNIVEIEKINSEVEVKKINNRIDKLLDLHLDGKLPKEKYTEKYDELLNHKAKYESRIKELVKKIKELTKLKTKAEKGEEEGLINDDHLPQIIQERIKSIKILEVQNKELIKEEYPNRQDKIVLIQINTYISDDNFYFLISQRTPYTLRLPYFEKNIEEVLEIIQSQNIEYIKDRIDFNPWEVRKKMKEEIEEKGFTVVR